MNGTRIVWLVGALLVGAAVAVLAWPEGDRGSVQGTVDATSSEGAPEAAPAPAAPTAAPAPTAPAASPAAPSAMPAAAAPDAPAPKPAAPRDPAAIDLGLDKVIPHAKVIVGSIVRRPGSDGKPALFADGRFEIRGAGTQADPYVVSWGCLASAQDTYVPRLQENDLPQRIAILDGAWVRIEGYLAFPLMVSETKELLVMLNQWDGCCIGVPPTPYDAIEVKLVEPAKRGGKHATFNYGGVRGTLKVDPYLVENWLVGLYILENAKMIEGAKPEL